MLQWLKEHVSVITFVVGILSMFFSLIVYLDTIHDREIAKESIEPSIALLRADILENRRVYNTNRDKIDDQINQIDKKIIELEKETITLHTKVEILTETLRKIAK